MRHDEACFVLEKQRWMTEGQSRMKESNLALKKTTSTSGFALPASSLRGNTGIGEAGIALKPATSRGFFADLGVQCYAGKRDGVAAALHAGRKY